MSAIVGAEWFVFRTINSKSRLEVLAASERRWELPPLPVRRDGTKAEILELEAATSRNVVWFDEHRTFIPSDPIRAKAGARGLVHPVSVGENFVVYMEEDLLRQRLHLKARLIKNVVAAQEAPRVLAAHAVTQEATLLGKRPTLALFC